MKSITLTVIFEGHALNRDEKIAGNILSIKKLTYLNKELSYISRPAMRHYLFNTLLKAYPDSWKEAGVVLQGSGDKRVVQLDIIKDDIFTSAELDAFGYMYTISGGSSITRKAPVGITKAVSLIPYNNDMQFNANHDLVKRALVQGINATPGPNQREENMSFFKVSFTIDAKFLGQDVWIVEGYTHNENFLIVELVKTNDIVFTNVQRAEYEEEGISKFTIDGEEIIIEGRTVKISENLVEKSGDGSINIKGTEKKKKKNKKEDKSEKSTSKLNPEYYEYDENEKVYIINLSDDYNYDENSKKLHLKVGLMKYFKEVKKEEDRFTIYSSTAEKKKLGCISFSPVGEKYRMVMTLDEQIKRERIRQILEAIKNGLVAHSSGEDNTIIPLFLIAAPVKVPSPIFHPYIHLEIDEDKPKVIGLSDCFRNSWLEDKVYVYVSERFKAYLEPYKDRVYANWEDFLIGCGLLKKEGEEENASASS